MERKKEEGGGGGAGGWWVFFLYGYSSRIKKQKEGIK